MNMLLPIRLDERPLAGSFLVVTQVRIYEVFVQPSHLPLEAWIFDSVPQSTEDLFIVPGKVVGMFLTREMALACAKTPNLRPRDRRFEDYTEATIKVARICMEGFPLSELDDLREVDLASWMKVYKFEIL